MQGKTVITEVVKETVDSVTGQVTKTESVFTKKIPQTPDFVMAFTQDIGFICKISGAASKLLFGILVEINRANEIVLVKEVKERISKKVGLKLSTINRLVTELYQSEVLLKPDNGRNRSATYTLNPFFFGKGKWINVNKLRMLVEYDFVKGKRTFDVETEYIEDKDDIIGQIIEHKDVVLEGLEKIRNSKIDFIDAETIEEATQEQETPPQNKNKEETAYKNETITDTADVSEVEILKLKMQAELAEKEKIEAENERLRLKIELAKISKTKEERSLFDMPSNEDKDF